MTVPVAEDLSLNNANGIILSVKLNESVFEVKISEAQLLKLDEEIADILEPKRVFEKRLKELKKFKREAYMDFQREKDPDLKEQRLKLYVEAKQLVNDLEQGRE
ncbi:hypothetical protein Desaci_4777 (plasmid) [Desulfosporosinus acidiphilus SJ4]|uniref:Uncharacterized protein n=1 Tax=Desulfosporosinus acidiphilus (strain DSM 22704 / JCM 16185 / SJ4) TaxID=646529 RepID=I4DCS8_DESAJ|nr:hypothetical protein [Desulfosporosinus acidiphilus]AFM43602.1 hypothetical protein Desaci_4777 [Desulfosporosinus acidiphilus SJ4]